MNLITLYNTAKQSGNYDIFLNTVTAVHGLPMTDANNQKFVQELYDDMIPTITKICNLSKS